MDIRKLSIGLLACGLCSTPLATWADDKTALYRNELLNLDMSRASPLVRTRENSVRALFTHGVRQGVPMANILDAVGELREEYNNLARPIQDNATDRMLVDMAAGALKAINIPWVKATGAGIKAASPVFFDSIYENVNGTRQELLNDAVTRNAFSSRKQSKNFVDAWDNFDEATKLSFCADYASPSAGMGNSNFCGDSAELKAQIGSKGGDARTIDVIERKNGIIER